MPITRVSKKQIDDANTARAAVLRKDRAFKQHVERQQRTLGTAS
jgi:hypothetical protein